MFDKIGLYNWIYKTKYLIPFASIFNSLAFEMAGIFFFNLEWGKALIILKNMRYSPFIIFGGLFIISKFIKVPKKSKIESKKNVENEKKIE